MGLDMYLEARQHIYATDWQAGDFENKTPQYLEISRMFPEGSDEFASGNGASVILPVGYWRKANAIHNWFVKNVQNGVDECQSAFVPDAKLRELRATVQHLLDNRDNAEATKHLPPAEGFFFGSYDLDDWYWENLERTVKILDRAIILAEDWGCSIYYQSSW